jgi:hypothetical protein
LKATETERDRKKESLTHMEHRIERGRLEGGREIGVVEREIYGGCDNKMNRETKGMRAGNRIR